MPLLYNYNFEVGGDVSVSVSFYDEDINIIKAESLAQISSTSRRIWAQRVILALEKVKKLPLRSLEPSQQNNLFQTRLNEEKWGDAVAWLTETDNHIALHIYKLYIIIFSFITDKVSCACC